MLPLWFSGYHGENRPSETEVGDIDLPAPAECSPHIAQAIVQQIDRLRGLLNALNIAFRALHTTHAKVQTVHSALLRQVYIEGEDIRDRIRELLQTIQMNIHDLWSRASQSPVRFPQKKYLLGILNEDLIWKEPDEQPSYVGACFACIMSIRERLEGFYDAEEHRRFLESSINP
jgi:hypothetical protein